VYLGQDVQIGEHVVLDAQQGPIVIEHGASIAPFSYVQGPVLIGARARVIDHASIKEHTATGHTVKIGGEVEGSILEPYTNKQHHGFLGHAYVGSWVNLGAGTTNSDLKNTYGIINVEANGKTVSTGMRFLGCIIGDYCKTAINTSIFTGKMIGVCSLLYGFVTTNVPSFTNYARSFGQITEVSSSVVALAQERMFQRRGVEQRPEDVALLEKLHRLTRRERQLSAEQIVW
jgi:glucose-1-phosphate thymidylyltransferase